MRFRVAAPMAALLLCAASLGSAQARTPHWQLLARPDDGRTIFGDTENISHQRKLVVTWILTNYKSPQPITHGPGSPFHGTAYRSEVEKILNDCEGKRIASVWVIMYAEKDRQGERVGDFEGDPGTEEWMSVLPGTVGDSELDFACDNAPAPHSQFSPATMLPGSQISPATMLPAPIPNIARPVVTEEWRGGGKVSSFLRALQMHPVAITLWISIAVAAALVGFIRRHT